MDFLSLGRKPFVELGFIPEKLASGSQTVIYWKGNVTPPSDYKKRAELVKVTIEHWVLKGCIPTNKVITAAESFRLRQF